MRSKMSSMTSCRYGRDHELAVTASWNIGGLLSGLTVGDRHPAVIAFGEEGSETWDGATVADKALRLACGLRDAGIGRASRVALWAPNSPVWIVAALAVLTAGGVAVPIDDQADAEQLDAALTSSAARLIFTTARHLEAFGDTLRAHAARIVLVDEDECDGRLATGWLSLLSERTEDLPTPGPDEPALLSWTSGTTGSPKAFLLSHRNIATNIEALQKLNVVGPRDRALLPLPLHHVYPLIVGMLTNLTIGTAIVLPGGTTGPLLMRAMREADVTTIIGVPRLYDAVWAAIETRVAGRGGMARLLWRVLLTSASAIQRSTGLHLGRLLFAPVRRGIAARLRLLVSGGARLERETEERLEAFGWTVLSGYGLAETASLFTGNRPGARRPGSAGRPLDGEVRIAEPDGEGIGEVELRGNSITEGYLDNPEANRAAFAPDGWYRTGDLGFVDRDGFLFVTGRVKEVLVLGGGKKAAPEDLERIYGDAPEIAEMAVLEDKGALVALVRPDRVKLHDRGATNLRDGIRVVLAEKARDLPSWQRLSGFALTDQPLPRTRLGKYRRFLLPALYAKALAGGTRRAAHAVTPEDAALLRDPTAEAVWALLRERYPEETLDLDVDLALDLNLDSFGWMEITIALEDRLDVHLSETDIAGIQTIRGLLRSAIERRGGAPAPPRQEPAMATDFERWLAPTGALLTPLRPGTLRAQLGGYARTVPAARHRRREIARDGSLRDHVQPRQRSRRAGDRRGAAVVPVPASLLGGRRGPNVRQPPFALLLPDNARLPGRCKVSRRGARKRPASAEGRPCPGLVPRGMALTRRQAAAFPARHRAAAAAQRRAGGAGLYRRCVRGAAPGTPHPQDPPDHGELRPSRIGRDLARRRRWSKR